jgi:hypothetical protein
MLTMDEVHQRIEPIRPVLVRAHQGAVGTWKRFATNEGSSTVFSKLGDTARAEFIHDLTTDYVANGIESVERVRITKLDFFSLLIVDQVLLRFKYLAADRPANSKSRQQQLLAAQEYDDEMMETLGLGSKSTPPLYVSCVYTLATRTDLGSVSIRMDCEGLQPWSFPIWGEGSAAAEPATFTNMPPVKPARVTSKRKQAKPQYDKSDGA